MLLNLTHGAFETLICKTNGVLLKPETAGSTGTSPGILVTQHHFLMFMAICWETCLWWPWLENPDLIQSCMWGYYASKVSDETDRPSCPPPSGRITSCLTLSTAQLPKLSRWSPAHIPKVPSQTTLTPFIHCSVFRPVLMHLKLFASLSWEHSVLHAAFCNCSVWSSVASQQIPGKRW